MSRANTMTTSQLFSPEFEFLLRANVFYLSKQAVNRS